MSRLPRVGDEVLLAVPQRERVLAHVAGMGAGFVELDLLESPRTAIAHMARVNLFIEFVNEDGVARMHGRLDATQGPHLLRFDHKGAVQLLQRRENVHAGAVLPLVVLRLGSNDEVAHRARTVDVSGQGMIVSGLVAPRVGENYRFDLELVSGDLPIAGQFTVVSVTEGDDAQVRFTSIDQRDRSHILHRAFQLSRHQRRRIA
jgi:hypothetical protein